MQHMNPSNLIDKLLPLDALPERIIATSDAVSPVARQPVLPVRMTQLMGRLSEQFSTHADLTQRIVQLFGGNPLGIAQRLPKGECICVNLARRIILDRAARERVRLPPDLLSSNWPRPTSPKSLNPKPSGAGRSSGLPVSMIQRTAKGDGRSWISI